MIQLFDKYSDYETPSFILCNPDGSEICDLPAEDREIVYRYNDVSDLSFTVYEQYSEDGEAVPFPFFDKICVRRMVLVEGVGYFQIVDDGDVSDGVERKKEVRCRSVQSELSGKTIDRLSGTFPFYNAVSNYTESGEPSTIVGFIMQKALGWSIGEVDSSLWGKYRTFDFEGKSVLDFIYSDLEEAFRCIAEFDILNKTISFRSVETLMEYPYNTDIYISYDNLLKNVKISEYSDEIKTKLYVSGQELDIRGVNPLGTDYIINVDHYANTEWMSQGLINSLNIWKAKIASRMNPSSGDYANILTSLSLRQAELATLQSELVDLIGVKKESENVMAVRMEQGLEYSELLTAVHNAESLISSKENEIEAKKSQIDAINQSARIIVADCKLENNFTSAELVELDKFIYEGSYSNTNYVVTDLMTANEIQTYATELYLEAVDVLSKMAQPRFTFDVEADNFVFLEEYANFTRQLEVGRILNIETSNGEVFCPVLLEISLNYDEPDSFSLKFGNRFRVTDGVYTYNDLIGKSQSVSSQVGANWSALTEFSKNYKSEVGDLLNNAFDVALREIVSSANQNQVWDSSGMTFRKWAEENNGYEDEQIKIINNKIVFTDDGWNTIKTAIGKIALTDGGTSYGIAAEAVVGRLLAGVNLVITNASNTFVIDENGISFITRDGNGIEQVETLNDYLTRNVESISEIIAGNIDGKTDTFYQSEAPHAEYIGVAENDDFDKLAGDLWYDTVNEKTFIYTRIENGDAFDYTWSEIGAVPQEVFDKLDGVAQIFVTEPVPPYSVGDLWKTVDGSGDDAELKICIADRSEGTFSSADWKDYNPNLSKGGGQGDNFEFTVNNEGVTIKNGDLEILNNLTKILLNPSDGIKIQKKTTGNTFTNQFYVDTDGTLTLAGNIYANGGTIGGWSISNNGLSNSNGMYYLNSDGSGKIGLMEFTRNTASFDGDVYVKNLKITDGSNSTTYIGNGHIEDGSISLSKLESIYKGGKTYSLASFATYVDEVTATTSSIASIEDDLYGTHGTAGIINTVNDLEDDMEAKSEMISQIIDSNGNIKAASIVTAVNNSGSSVTINADKVNLASLSITGNDIAIGDSGRWSSYISFSNDVHMPNLSIVPNDPGSTWNPNHSRISLTEDAYIDSYLGVATIIAPGGVMVGHDANHLVDITEMSAVAVFG